MTIQAARQQLLSSLFSVYEKREAGNIADWVIESLTGLKKIDRLVNADQGLSDLQENRLQQYTQQLLQHRPVQYVLGEAWFAGLKFFVDENVLIPRPETEELVDWVLAGVRNRDASKIARDIVDIGTGSGCIPIALKTKLPAANVYACDISEAALEIAEKNAKANQAAIQFIHCDILDENEWHKLPAADIIISNPPYIPLEDKSTMRENVLRYEPYLALFVTDKDPLVFYRAIAAMAIKRLKPGGALYLEIHEEWGRPLLELLANKGFSQCELRKDLQGKDRMIRAGL